MFCPRCGAAGIEEGLKFCRNCGLPLSQVTTYVASGGTNDLTAFNPPPPVPLSKLGFTPKQVLTLRIVGVLISPALVALLQELLRFPEEIIAITAIFVPFLVLLSFFRYRAQKMQIGAQQDVQRQLPVSPPPIASPRPKNTNPLEAPRPVDVPQPVSVIEDETVRFPEKRS
jgi:hypothetical protein